MSDNPAGLVSTEQLEITPYKWVHPDECGEILGGIAAELRGNRERPSKSPDYAGLFRMVNFADDSVFRDYGLRPIKAIVHADLHDVQRLFCNVVG
jgi:hypothetical protein